MDRLLFFTEHFPPSLGGVSVSAHRTVEVLCALGVSVDVIAWTRALPPGVVEAVGDNPRVFRVGRYRQWDNTFPHTSNLCDHLFSAHSYEAVWGHYLAPAGFFAAWIGKLHNIASTVSLRGNDLDRDMFPPGDFARLLWTLENATVVTSVTRELARKAAALTGRDDIVDLPNSVDCSVFRPLLEDLSLKAALGIGAEELVLGFCGELREKKGLTHILTALREVRAVRPACLLIIGEVRPSDMPKLYEVTGAASPAQHRILITGTLPGGPGDVNRHLQLCDVFLQPSLWDGMPNALLEAMAAGIGCIASDAGGIPEIVTNAVDGIVIPRWELHRLSQAILEWADAPGAVRQRVRDAARARVAEHFTAQQERVRLEGVLALLGSTARKTAPR